MMDTNTKYFAMFELEDDGTYSFVNGIVSFCNADMVPFYCMARGYTRDEAIELWQINALKVIPIYFSYGQSF